MIEITSIGDDTSDGARDDVDRIFFASAGSTRFADESERSAFRERWLGRYLIHDCANAFLARASEGGPVVGYLVGCLDDPARADRFRDLDYYAGFADLTARYPAHLHINLDPAWRSRGIGGRLIEAFADHAARHGAPGVHVVTGAAARNVAFYQRCGFTPLREADWNGNAILILGRHLTPERAP